jgi:hypothetical protein
MSYEQKGRHPWPIEPERSAVARFPSPFFVAHQLEPGVAKYLDQEAGHIEVARIVLLFLLPLFFFPKQSYCLRGSGRHPSQEPPGFAQIVAGQGECQTNLFSAEDRKRRDETGYRLELEVRPGLE